MVSENNQEPVQAPLPNMDGAETPPPDNPIIAEIDRLNNTGTEAPAAEQPAAPVTDTPAPAPPEQAPVAAPEQPVAPQPVGQQLTPEQIQQMQQQAAQYQEVQQRAALQQEAQRYQQQLESQGYLPDQAQQIAHQHMQSRSAQVQQQKSQQYQLTEIQGKQAAAEHFAKRHNLNFDDMATLRLAETPDQMEQVAKKMSEDRKVRDELAELRKAQVPAQTFDNSQGNPEVASNDGSWLDRYNSGDRSPNAVAAAKKLLGYE